VARGQLGARRLQLLRAQVPQLDRRAAVEEAGDRAEADPTRAAGDDDPAALEVEERIGPQPGQCATVSAGASARSRSKPMIGGKASGSTTTLTTVGRPEATARPSAGARSSGSLTVIPSQ
jgi:hypothetical protein